MTTRKSTPAKTGSNDGEDKTPATRKSTTPPKAVGYQPTAKDIDKVKQRKPQ